MTTEAPWPVRVQVASPVAAGAVLWRWGDALNVTVIVKATFALVHEADLTLAEPGELLRAELHHRDNPARSVRATSNLGPYLSRADVLLTGHARAPGGSPAPSVAVRLAVHRDNLALIDKTLHVHGERKVGAPKPFLEVPLVYERAFGGLGWDDNPLGVGVKAGKAHDPSAPSIVRPDAPLVTAGFGPISRTWPARRRLLGALDRQALAQPVVELPAGFDWAYFQAAPEDQRVDYLRGDESITIENVDREHARLVSRLPGARAAGRVYGLDASAPERPSAITFNADTLRIDVDERRCSLVWRGVVKVASEAALASIVVVAGLDLPGRSVEWPAPEAVGSDDLVTKRTGPERSPPRGGVDRTYALSLDQEHAAASRPSLPFTPEAPPAAPLARAAAPSPRAPATPPPRRDVPRRTADAIPFINPTSLTSFTLPWQMQPGRDARVVVLKGTFDIVPDGPATIRVEPDLPSGDVHEGGQPMRSLRYPTDFAIFKPKADVTLHGHAYAPRGSSPASRVTFRFGRKKNGFDRSIAVFGERRWQGAIRIAPTEPRPFQKMPLLYEHAFGGAGHDDNPVGVGRDGALLPNLEDPANLVRSPSDTPAPATFGAIPMLWRPRWSKLGTFGDDWQKSRWPYFPEDFDWTFFQAAPPAQQLAHLDGDETFDLVGVHPKHPSITGSLPRLRARCFAQKTTDAGEALHEVVLRLDTATFDADALKLHLVWRGLLEVRDDEASDVAELFVMVEPLASSPATLVEARAAYEAARAPLAPVGGGEGDAPANDVRGDGRGDDALTPHERRIRERLDAAGMRSDANLSSAPVAAPLPPVKAPEHLPAELDPIRREVQARLASGGSLAGLDLRGAELSDLDFSGRSLAGARLDQARLCRCRFTDADLTDSGLAGADLTDATLVGAALERADLTGASLEGADFTRARVDDADFSGARGARASFREARGKRPRFVEGAWQGARFDQAELEAADFTRAALDEAVFDDASLPAIRLYDARGIKASFKNARLDGARADGVHLTRCSLQGASAPSSIWEKAVLDESSFRGAKLVEASFVRASCLRTTFSGADLAAGRLSRARLAGAAFLKTNLMAASLESADLEGADLRGANLHGAELWKAKLSGAKLELAILTQTKLEERT